MRESSNVRPIRPLEDVLVKKLAKKYEAEFMEHLKKKGIRPKRPKSSANGNTSRT